MAKTSLDFNKAEELDNNIIEGFIDKSFVNKETQKKIDHLIDKYSKNIFSLIIYKVTGLKLTPSESKEIWSGIIAHKYHLKKSLRRDPGIYVSAVDFLVNMSSRHIKSPVVIDEKYFNNLKMNILVDDITGLYNANFFNKRIKEEISESKRYKSPLSLLVVDIDDFSKINEYMGVDEGNNILKDVGNCIQTSVRSSDVAIRYEGGKYTVILPHTGKKDALIVGEKLRIMVSNLKSSKKITISGGVATFLVDTKKDAAELFNIANSALYRAKYEGKDRICDYPQEQRKFRRIPITEKLSIKIKIIKPALLQQKIKKIKNISKGGLAFYIEDIQLNKTDYIEGTITQTSSEIK
ncbi:MAG: GGDEF domain-containing protein, partial [Spirochaetes bacterium]|nr:GGDEF domain-containing protein [Spirochaetota bacterium]